MIEDRLRALGLELPSPPRLPTAIRPSFRMARRTGNLLYLSGWGPLRDGVVVYRGKIGSDLTVEDGYAAARLTGLGMLATVRDQLGSLDRVAGWVKVLGLVNSAPGFSAQPAVIDGCSDLILDVFGEERGGHARSAIGVAELPMGIAVEIEAIVEIAPDER